MGSNDRFSFIDAAAKFDNCTDFITAQISCKVNKDGLDTHFHSVLIQSPTLPTNETGNWRAFISKADCDIFEACGACILILELQKGKHALFMIRNETTDTCEIHDPNGDFDYSFMAEDVKGFFQAINMGLLRPLTSPKGNNTVFNVSLQSPLAGLQSFEAETEQNLKILFHENITLAPFELLFDSFFTNESFPGFCLSWSLLRFIDHINGTHIVKELNNALLGTKGLKTLQSTAQKVLFERFCGELPQNNLTNKQLKLLFNRMLPCIIIRLVATQLTLVMKAPFPAQPFSMSSMETFLSTMKTEIEIANGGNVIFNAKHLWKDSCRIDLNLNNDMQFILACDVRPIFQLNVQASIRHPFHRGHHLIDLPASSRTNRRAPHTRSKSLLLRSSNL